MKVLHIGKFYPPFCGGIEKVNYDLVENLNKIENCNVDELCFQHLAGNETDDLTPAYRLFRVPIRTIFIRLPSRCVIFPFIGRFATIMILFIFIYLIHGLL